MAKDILTVDQVLTLPDGRYHDGDGLVLEVRHRGRARRYRYEYDGKLVGDQKNPVASLGSVKKNSLEQIRQRRDFCKHLLLQGISPKKWKQEVQKKTRTRINAGLTVGDVIEGCEDFKDKHGKTIPGFYQWGANSIWKRGNTRKHKRWVIDRYFKDAPIWNMPAVEVDVDDAVTLLEPYWFNQPATGKRIQSFGFALFKWLRPKLKLTGDNPFRGDKYGALIDGLGGQQPPGKGLEDPEPDDLVLVMAHLRVPPTHDDDVWTVNELATACESSADGVRKLIKRGYFPGAYKWADWGTATYLIPFKDIKKVEAEGRIQLRHPLRKQIEVGIESLCLQFQLMTVVRPEMACNLKKDYVKRKRGLITYPPEGHKEGSRTNDEYNVVLTEEVEKILDAALAYQERHHIESDYVFVKGYTKTGINTWAGKLVDQNTLWHMFKTLLVRLPDIEKPKGTPHGARTSFVTWAVDIRDHDVHVVDAMLGHKIKGIQNKTYFRNVKYFRQAQIVAADWQQFLLSNQAKIEPIPYRSRERLARFPTTQERNWDRRGARK
jgi:integrase